MNITAYFNPARQKQFWAKIQILGPDDCWPWLAYRRKSGHGYFNTSEGPISASRVVYALEKGEQDPDLCILHKCHNAWCCNPRHLEQGTRAQNMWDRKDHAIQENRSY